MLPIPQHGVFKDFTSFVMICTTQGLVVKVTCMQDCCRRISPVCIGQELPFQLSTIFVHHLAYLKALALLPGFCIAISLLPVLKTWLPQGLTWLLPWAPKHCACLLTTHVLFSFHKPIWTSWSDHLAHVHLYMWGQSCQHEHVRVDTMILTRECKHKRDHAHAFMCTVSDSMTHCLYILLLIQQVQQVLQQTFFVCVCVVPHLCAPPAWMSWHPHCCCYAAHSMTWCVQGPTWLWPWTPKPCVQGCVHRMGWYWRHVLSVQAKSYHLLLQHAVAMIMMIVNCNIGVCVQLMLQLMFTWVHMLRFIAG